MGDGTRTEGDKDECVELLKTGDKNGDISMEAYLVRNLWTDKSFNVRAIMDMIKGVWSLR